MEERERKRRRGARTLTSACEKGRGSEEEKHARACKLTGAQRACTHSSWQKTSRERGGRYRVAVCILIALLPQLAAARHSN